MATTPHHLNPRGARRAALLVLPLAALLGAAPSAADDRRLEGAAARLPKPRCFSSAAPAELARTNLAAPSPARRRHSYGWPLKPFDRQHPIRAHFNDPREGERDSRQFHFGIDISAPNGTPVYAIEGGTVYLSGARAVSVRALSGRVFGYWHIVPVVREHQAVGRHQLLGHIEAPWAHVHLAESVDGRHLNPLRPGALGPYVDPTVPQVDDVRFVRGDRPLAPTSVGGRVDLVADVYDTVPLPVRPRWWAGMPVTPATLRWRVLREDGGVVVAWRRGPALGGRFREAGEFRSVYWRRTRQNHPRRPGRYCVLLTRGWDSSSLAQGRYGLEVQVADLGGNRQLAHLPFAIPAARGGGR